MAIGTVNKAHRRKLKLKIFCSLVLLTLLIGCGGQNTERQIDAFQLTSEPLFSAKFSKDGQWVSVYTTSKTIEVWDLASRINKFSLPMSALGEVARAYALSNDKKKLFIAGEHRLSIWAVNDGDLIQYYNIKGADPLARVSSMAIAPNDQFLALGMSDGSVVLMSFETSQLQLFKPHEAEVTDLIWNKDSKQVISAGHDGLVSRWSVTDAKTILEYYVPKRVTSLAVDNNFDAAFVSDSLSDQHLFDVKSGKKLTYLRYSERFRWFRSAYLFDELPYLVTSSSKTQLYIWDRNDGSLLKSFHIHADDKEALVLDMSAKSATSIKTISSEGVVENWDIANLTLN